MLSPFCVSGIVELVADHLELCHVIASLRWVNRAMREASQRRLRGKIVALIATDGIDEGCLFAVGRFRLDDFVLEVNGSDRFGPNPRRRRDEDERTGHLFTMFRALYLARRRGHPRNDATMWPCPRNACCLVSFAHTAACIDALDDGEHESMVMFASLDRRTKSQDLWLSLARHGAVGVSLLGVTLPRRDHRGLAVETLTHPTVSATDVEGINLLCAMAAHTLKEHFVGVNRGHSVTMLPQWATLLARRLTPQPIIHDDQKFMTTEVASDSCFPSPHPLFQWRAASQNLRFPYASTSSMVGERFPLKQPLYADLDVVMRRAEFGSVVVGLRSLLSFLITEDVRRSTGTGWGTHIDVQVERSVRHGTLPADPSEWTPMKEIAEAMGDHRPQSARLLLRSPRRSAEGSFCRATEDRWLFQLQGVSMIEMDDADEGGERTTGWLSCHETLILRRGVSYRVTPGCPRFAQGDEEGCCCFGMVVESTLRPS